MKIGEIVKSGKGTIIDVRTAVEFREGHVAGSVNIPLHEIEDRLEEIKGLQQPLVLCCMSGNRSGQACYFLSSEPITCYNGGSWFELDYIQKQEA